MADHTEVGRPAAPWREQSKVVSCSMSSQAPREPMFPFEFVAELFQFEQREPQFEPLSQLPPTSKAL